MVFAPVDAGASASAENCARAAWELWRTTRQDSLQAAGMHALTEGRNPATTEIDRLPTLDMLRLINLEDTRVTRAVGSQLAQIAEAVDRIAERMRRGGRMIYAGAGTSGRIGVLDASEIPPTYGTSPELVVALIAGGDIAVRSSLEGVEDDTAAGMRAVQELSTGPEDSLIGIAASGRTPYVIGAMEEARRRGALTVSVACNSPAPMEDLADVVITPLVGAEVITGSTRMKAGTAQKLVLNMLSTCVMVRLGKTFSNLMVDMQATNTKLRGRARRIVAQVAGVSEHQAGEILDAAGGELKTAIVMARSGATPEQARQRLSRSGGVVRAALEPEGAHDQ
ncbi:MAG: N-acetylmuramic acid 6-phosphate etherase [Chloroflexi bacterium]|nr:MAG: N-acetylmuramic acid 6-phosphate etherase [Chloroflexota bacterium]